MRQTPFTQNEAHYMKKVSWYNDKKLNSAILNFFEFKKNMIPSGIILDIGCGVSSIAEPLSKRFETYYGIDCSKAMCMEARKTVNCHFNDNKIFLGDAIKVICKNAEITQKTTHILIKNSLQYMDVFWLFDLIASNFNDGVICQIVLTLRPDYTQDIYKKIQHVDYVQPPTYYFAKRTIEKIIECDFKFQILNKRKMPLCQSMNFLTWLDYHGAAKAEKKEVIKVISNMHPNELKYYNLEKVGDEYIMKRYVTLISFCNGVADEKIYC